MKNLSKKEKSWILYDVGNSAFILLATTVLPIIFNNLAKAHLSDTDYLAYWGYAVSLATVITAVLGPILGTISDRRGKMPFFKGFLALGLLSFVLLTFTGSYQIFLVLYVLAKIGFNGSNVFYDGMLVDISSMKNRDNVSSQGYAWGYIGSVVPFLAAIGLIFSYEKLGISMNLAIGLSIFITAIWWLAFSIPLIRTYEQKYFNQGQLGLRPAIKKSFKDLGLSLKEIVKDKEIFLFLLAFFFYIDGVSTIINMATAYGASLGLSPTGLILALLMTQLVAFPATIFFARASSKKGPEKLLNICIVAYAVIVVIAMAMVELWQFWVLAFMVGLFQGAIQSLSRSHFSKIIPQDKAGSYFGIYDIFGKGAAVFGTMAISILSQVTGNQQGSLAILIVFFILGLIFFNWSLKTKEKVES